MAQMSKQSASGNLTGFSGIFSVTELNDHEKDFLEAILNEYSDGNTNISEDLTSLISITSEVKAINNQAAILHGERIKKAHNLLTKYKEGAFTSWIIAAYGNRQTPYNFMQYYEFYQAMPKQLRLQIESMPRQAIYTLASREGTIEKKKKIVENYKGETKAEILNIIRETFPLSLDDKRRPSAGETAINGLQRLCNHFSKPYIVISKKQKKSILDLIDYLRNIVEECDMT
jgi:hypothetical protein